ncbi:MAG: L,D-transpeptidase family protein [Burkholderiales bacterium]|nr:L,D-transpeptidase family protein [Burkholderiales bacterium]
MTRTFDSLRFLRRTLARATLFASLLVVPSGVMGGAGFGYSDAETLLLRALREIRFAQLDRARQTISELLDRYPNYRLAYLVQGDLWLAKARPLQSVGDTPTPAESLAGLRAEAAARVRREADTARPDQVPANFWRIADTQPFALAVDTDKSRLYVLENRGGQLVRIADFYASIGKAGGGKAREGDQRTPLGAYVLQGAVSRDRLTDFYGSGAFPLDYPNIWDRRQGRNGYGIWLHGVPSDTYARAPRASDGCVVVSNPDLKLIERFVVPGRTPFLIAQNIDWVDRDAAQRQSQGLLTAVERWRSDWQALDTPRYLQHYAPNFASDTQRLSEWRAQKIQANAAKTWAKIELANLSAVQYPGEKDLAVVTFDQNYQSSNLSGQSRKRQLWQRIDGRWQIIYEGSA